MRGNVATQLSLSEKIRFVPVEDIPHNATRKIQRHEVEM